jgi:prepilin-type N-terminal cleavage/methylation domain-containing protein
MRARLTAGFTLIEILAVIALFALIVAVVAVRLGGGSSVAIRGSARVLAAELEYAAQRAVTTGRPHRWHVDLDRQVFRMEAEPLPAEEEAAEPARSRQLDLAPPLPDEAYAPVQASQGRWRELDEARIGIDEVIVGGQSIQIGEAAIAFSPDGGADPAEVWLLDPEGRQLQLRVTAFTGEIEVSEVMRDDR